MQESFSGEEVDLHKKEVSEETKSSNNANESAKAMDDHCHSNEDKVSPDKVDI